MNTDIMPTVIVGAGPAGASAALALCDRGMPVTLLDAGTQSPSLPPPGAYLDLRFADSEQWRWQLGSTFDSFAAPTQASPKLRVPGLHPLFAEYADANRLRPEAGFHLVGALAAGGLSNAWGCGVARFDDDELGALAAAGDAMGDSYARVARRMGLSGAEADALQSYFGLDEWARPALPLDPLHARLWKHRDKGGDDAFRLGRARVAVLNEDRDGRRPCDLSGTCLWGCTRRATWSAAFDIESLRRRNDVRYEPGIRVQGLRREEDGWTIDATTAEGGARQFRAERVLLAAGTLASTRLALAALPDPPSQVRLLSNPTAAFLLLLPTMLGQPRERGFGLAQLSFVLERLHAGEAAMGNLFSTTGLPVSEFLAHLPITRQAGLPLLRALLPASVVGNVFLPGALSEHSVSMDDDGAMRIRGGFRPELAAVHATVERRLRSAFRRMGAWMLPGSFVPGGAGADIHYAGTMPISRHPRAHECHLSGEIAGLPGVYAIDGAALPSLPAKAHTLTIIANADRIARGLP